MSPSWQICSLKVLYVFHQVHMDLDCSEVFLILLVWIYIQYFWGEFTGTFCKCRLADKPVPWKLFTSFIKFIWILIARRFFLFYWFEFIPSIFWVNSYLGTLIYLMIRFKNDDCPEVLLLLLLFIWWGSFKQRPVCYSFMLWLSLWFFPLCFMTYDDLQFVRFFGWAGFSKRLFVITIYSRSLLSSYRYIMMAQNEPELFGEEVSIKDFSMSFLCLTLPSIFTWADNLYYNLTFCCVSELMIEILLLIEVHF